MTTCTQPTLPPSIFPTRFQILSGSALKLLACILMLIDHTGVRSCQLKPRASGFFLPSVPLRSPGTVLSGTLAIFAFQSSAFF